MGTVKAIAIDAALRIAELNETGSPVKEGPGCEQHRSLTAKRINEDLAGPSLRPPVR